MLYRNKRICLVEGNTMTDIHQNHDRAVMRAYGFQVGEMTESECVAELMRMYQDLTANTTTKTAKGRG